MNLQNAVVICDEAGLQSNRQGFMLLQLAQKYNMRVRFVGDSRQHVSVEAGDFLRVMETHSQLEAAEVSSIERQKHPGYREAIVSMAAHQVRGGLEKLDDLGWILDGKSDYLANAAKDYLHFTQNGRELGNCLAVCPTWDENFRLTEHIRTALKRAGTLVAGNQTTIYHSLKWTEAQKRSESNYRPGLVRTLESWEQGRYEPSGMLRERVLAVLRGRHEAAPDLRDASDHITKAAEHLERITGLGSLIGLRLKPKLRRMAEEFRKQSQELADLAEISPPAGNVL